MADAKPHYDVLGVPEDASQSQIKAAFFELVRDHPPEKDPDAYQRLREAYDVLSDPVSRREYDTMAEHGDEIEKLKDEAEALLNRDRPDAQRAIKKLKRAAELGPDISLLRSMLGQAYFLEDQPGEALEQFDKAIDLNPENPAYRIYRGYALQELHPTPEAAEKEFRTVWEANKDNYVAARALASTLAVQDQYEEAHSVLDQTIWADDVRDFEDFFCYYDKLFLYVAQNKTNELEESLETIISVAETPADQRYAVFMLAQAADELYVANAFSLSHRFAKAAEDLGDGSVEIGEHVDHLKKLRELEESLDSIMSSDWYHEAVQQMMAIYYDRATGAMAEAQANQAIENLVQGLENLMQADPDHSEIKRSLRRIRKRYPEAFELNEEFFELILDVPDAQLFTDDCPHCRKPVTAEKGSSDNLYCPHCNLSIYSRKESFYTSEEKSNKRQDIGNRLGYRYEDDRYEDDASSSSHTSNSTLDSKRNKSASPSSQTGSSASKERVTWKCCNCGSTEQKDPKIKPLTCDSCGGEMRKLDQPSRSTSPIKGSSSYERPAGLWRCHRCGIKINKAGGVKAVTCPSCDKLMYFSDPHSENDKYDEVINKLGKTSKSNALRCAHEYSNAICQKCGWSKSELKSIDGSSGPTDRSKDCFVATAVYGDIDHPDVRQLRSFRDDTLQHTILGRAFIGWYYRNGETLAEWLDNQTRLKKGTRFILQQIVERYLR